MVELRKEKTVEQLAEERALLSKIRLCKHNQYQACRPYNGKPCNFAHWLQYLTVPEDMYGNWSNVWQQGEVDVRFWHSYHPNTESLERFSWQFQFERKRWPDRIPNWAWGHALYIGLLRKEDVPTHTPKDFDWPKLQSAWSQGKAHGSTASVVTEVATSSNTPHVATEDGEGDMLSGEPILCSNMWSVA